MPINKNNLKDIEVQINCEKYLQAPVTKNQKIGVIQVKVKDEVIVETYIIIKETIEKKTIVDYMLQLILNYEQYLKTAIRS